MNRYTLHITPLFFYLLIVFFFVIRYVSCELPPAHVTAMDNIHKLLQNNSNSKWNDSQNLTNPCSWPGVSCTPNNSSIIKLLLSSFSISDDSWASFVCEIETLESLDLSNNQLTSIPKPFLSSCGSISSLKVLNFSQNILAGTLPSFQNLSSLEVLDLSGNMFDGVSVDLQFDSLNKLKSLNISMNRFGGSVPTKLGNSMSLQELQLSFNSFNSTISEELADFQNLTILDLSGNLLTGAIPSRIGELANLQYLILSGNYLSGKIPNSISSITSLKRFAANGNGFTGSIPQGITRYLRNLDLSYNQLNGSIPSDLLSQLNLQTVDLSFNELEGFVPLNISRNLVRLRLGSNRLSGKIPEWTFLNNIASLMYLEIDHNRLNGTIPPELKGFKNLSLLDLSYNNLVGLLPQELGDLNQLQVLQLSHNNLSGSIPDEISQLQMLLKLNISWNSISGSIPSSLSRLQKLSNLDLRVNNLVGDLPDSLRTMDSLLELQLGGNQLGGYIRSLPSKLQIALNLSHNNFEGPIPNVLNGLRSLEILDLSNNRFSGEIPGFLKSMESLTLLVLSNNMLSGSKPEFGSNVIVLTDGNANLTERESSPPTHVTDKQKPANIAIIAASASAVFLLTVFALALVLFSRRVHKVNNDPTEPTRPLIVKTHLLTNNVIHRSNLDITKAMEAVKYPSNIVSKTRFSTYHKAVMPSGTSYFVKKLNLSDKIFQIESQDLFEKELQILGNLRNSSVMVPLAYALTTNSAYLFYEFNEKGSLFDVLHGSLLGSGLDWTNRYSIAIGVANGLAFLHGCPSGPIILLDLSARVVMLKSLNEPQIGDIELSKVFDPSKSTGNLSAVAGSVGYVPPEYAYTMRVTTAGNVYSFGVILLELLTGKPAVSEGSELAKWVLSKSKQSNNFDKILDSNVSRTSSTIKIQMLAVLKVALACVSVSPDARPKMRSVLRMLLNARN